ncbi:MAG: TylF/MycF family methyltransferase [Candidatus Dormibacteraeota bacterium]|nr:TylF/MycF family methyltransferase [Candidatus Dormibacteraeota bacterium]
MVDLDTLSANDRAIIARCLPYTMTSVARLLALVDAVRYCTGRGLTGALVECGVWRGGSVLAIIGTLQELGISDRELWLYDTFEGMTAPTDKDVSAFDPPAIEIWQEAQRLGVQPWPEFFRPEVFNEAGVRRVLESTGYPPNRIHLVAGPVEQTLPASIPGQVALLRLDTDWYESTRHELQHLYPLLIDGGALIIDDYGHWAGCRQAVDEYFAEHPGLLLTRVDYTARIAVKH